MRLDEMMTKPSEALQYMVDGLIEQDASEGRAVDMGGFFKVRDGVCFACAAVCCLQRLVDGAFDSPEEEDAKKRAEGLEVHYSELVEFEGAMDNARIGRMRRLFRFFNLEAEFERDVLWQYGIPFCLYQHSWKEELPKVVKIIEELKQKGY